jgi:two-component system NtrC family response regulator
MATVLIIDDDELVCKSLSRSMERLGHVVMMAGSLRQGLALAHEGVDVIFLDLQLPDGNGQESIAELAATKNRPEIVVISGAGVDREQRVLAHGVWEYINKPVTPEDIRKTLEATLEFRSAKFSKNIPSLSSFGILGAGVSMQEFTRSISQAAASDAGVLLLGETGVGKELAARAIHTLSSRNADPFVVVDCSNMPPNLIESLLYGHVRGAFTDARVEHKGFIAEADKGTLFLDEIGELPLSLQKSFLRVLQERRYRQIGAAGEQTSNFRLIAATNRNLDDMVKRGHFRSDLLFRLRTLEICLPPLRERVQDIPIIAESFVARFSRQYKTPPKQISRQTMLLLESYSWPGNVRELRNILEAAVIASGMADILYPRHLPRHMLASLLQDESSEKKPMPLAANGACQPASDMPCGQQEPPLYCEYKNSQDFKYFTQLLGYCGHNMAMASEISGLSVASVYRYLHLHGIMMPSTWRRSKKQK